MSHRTGCSLQSNTQNLKDLVSKTSTYSLVACARLTGALQATWVVEVKNKPITANDIYSQ